MFSVIYTDDEASLLEVGKIFLERSGLLEVETALSAKEAIGILSDKEIDCIVSDYMMPEMDGIAFLKHLRAENNQVPFILFTGRGREEVAIEALNAGADFYLQKGGDPVSQFTELEHKIRLAAGRKKTEEELRNSEEKYRVLTEMTNDIFYSMDLEGRITHIGPQVSRYGFRPEEIVSKKLEEMVFEEDLKTAVEDFEKTATTGEPTVTVFRITEKSGNLIWMEDSGGAVLNENGEICGISGILREITDRINIKEDLLESERKYRELVELLPQTVYETDEKGNLISVNKIAYEVFGYTPEDLAKGISAPDLLVPEDRERAQKNMERILQGETAGGMDYTAIRKDGTTIPVIIFSNLVKKNNRPAGLRGVVYDLSVQKNPGDRIEDKTPGLSERRLTDIISFLPDATFVIDLGGRVIAWNRAMEEMTGIPAGEMTGKGEYEYSIPFNKERRPILIDLALKPDEEIEGTYYPMVRREGNAIFGETDYPNPAGKSSILWGKATPLYDENGNITGAIESIRDITERKHAEEELRTLYNDLEERVAERTADLRQAQDAFRLANQKLNLLSSITRHDILNQLMGLKGFLNLLDINSADGELKGYVRSAQQAAANIERHITFTKMYQDIGFKQPLWQNVRGCIESHISGLLPEGVNCNIDVDGIEIYADPLCDRVIYTLIDNTIRHGKGATEIRFSSRPANDGRLILQYEDNGTGIPDADKEQIFQRGFGNNTGFGLFIAREILSITGIEIRETGEPGEGARFEITIPDGASRFNGNKEEN